MPPESTPVIRTVRAGDLDERSHAILFERRQSFGDLIPEVRAIMARVREQGDAALIHYAARFDGVTLTSLEVAPDEFAEAHALVDPAVRLALVAEMEAVRSFHERHLTPQEEVQTAPGVRVWREWRAIERVGLYVPGGRGAYPSSVIMLGVPAGLAGCSQVVLCTPPGWDGKVPAATLVAAELVGIHRVVKSGGAQAIAAMAYGTVSVPRVFKLFGAGNAYVTAAKLLAFPECALDAPAGPSELLIIADENARADWIAADLASDAEHGPDSAAVLVTTSPDLAQRVTAELERQLASLSREKIARQALHSRGLIVLTEAIEEATELANRYAPEHLEIMTASPRAVLAHVQNAGSIFLGSFSANAAGDYATGTNHVLPTASYARTFGPVSVESFGRMMQCQELTRHGLEQVSATVTTLARGEGLEGHARAVEMRLREELH
ncbi:MAG: histidinol dehydrogenase [Chloroflexota bacterium]